MVKITVMKNLLIVLFLGACLSPSLGQKLLQGMPQVDNQINDIVRFGDTVVIAGKFTKVAGLTRNYLAAFHANTGIVLPWNPNPDDEVKSILAVENRLLVGGNFLNISNVSKKYLAGYDLKTLVYESNIPVTNSKVQCLRYKDGNVYYPISVSSQKKIARFNLSTGIKDIWVSNGLNSAINIFFDINDDYIYVGGDFTSVEGLGKGYFARLRLDNGTYDSNKEYVLNGNASPINKVLAYKGCVYVAGNFDKLNNQSVSGIFQLAPSGDLTSFNFYCTNSYNLSLFGQKNTIWVGGNSSSIGLGYSYRISQIDLKSKYSTCWETNALISSSWVTSIFAHKDTVYIGAKGLNNTLIVTVDNPSFIDLGPDRVLPTGQNIILSAYKPGYTYLWNTGATSSSIAVDKPGIYSVEAFDNGWCTAYDSVTITSITAIENVLDEKKVLVTPNPVSDFINININSLVSLKFEIYGFLGQKFLEGTIATENTRIDIRSLESGNYILRLTDENQAKSVCKKIIITN